VKLGITGSYFYMAPEILLGFEYETLSDIWSLGILMYMMISNHHPFDEFYEQMS